MEENTTDSLPLAPRQARALSEANTTETQPAEVHRKVPAGTDEFDIVGNTVDGRYEVLSLVGQGGMSAVYKARHKLMDRLVAVKVLHSYTSSSPEAVLRFKQEARALSALDHANIVAVHSVHVSQRLGLYLVMDYLEGISLANVIDEIGPLSPEQALPLFRQICSALGHAHQRGIIHRDLKPSNVMLLYNQDTGEQDLVKLVDFGIAKLLAPDGSAMQQLTRADSMFGTPPYMSPEQCRGEALDARSDIYALGCLMFETLVGRPPLECLDSPLKTMSMQLTELPPLLSEALPGRGLPVGLEEVVDRCLNKCPDSRFASCAELLEALERIDLHNTGATPRPTSSGQSAAASGKKRIVGVPRTSRFAFRLRAPAPLIIVAAVLLTVSALYAIAAMVDGHLKAEQARVVDSRIAELQASIRSFHNPRLAVEHRGDYILALEQLCALYSDAGRWDEGISFFKQETDFLEQNWNDPCWQIFAQTFLADLYWSGGYTGEARSRYALALEELNRTNFDWLRTNQQALAGVARAIERASETKSVQLVQTLERAGWIFARDGHYNLAASCYRRGLQVARRNSLRIAEDGCRRGLATVEDLSSKRRR